MLLLIFEVGDGRYALAASQLVEIVPLVNLDKIPIAPDFVAGLMNYRGDPVPVVDLCRLLRRGTCEQKLSTRIIIIHYPFVSGKSHLLGLIAERVTKTIKYNMEKIPSLGFVVNELPRQEDTVFETGSVIQYFDIKLILPKHEIRKLFKD